MEQVEGFLQVCLLSTGAQHRHVSAQATLAHMQGERDYTQLRGPTGPLVYPAGFIYAYTSLHWLSGGGQIWPAQIAFAVFYLTSQASTLLPSKQIAEGPCLYVLRVSTPCSGAGDGAVHKVQGRAALGAMPTLPFKAAALHFPPPPLQ